MIKKAKTLKILGKNFNVYEKDGELGAFMKGPAKLVFDGEF